MIHMMPFFDWVIFAKRKIDKKKKKLRLNTIIRVRTYVFKVLYLHEFQITRCQSLNSKS